MVHGAYRDRAGSGMAWRPISFTRARSTCTKKGIDVRGGAEAVYFEPDNPLYNGYRNAVAAGGNFAIANRLLIWKSVGKVLREGVRAGAGTDL